MLALAWNVVLVQSFVPRTGDNCDNKTSTNLDRIESDICPWLVSGAVFEDHRELESGGHVREWGKPYIAP